VGKLTELINQLYGLQAIAITRIPHLHDLRPAYRVKTNKRSYFLKQYDWFDEHRAKGLAVVAELVDLGYPALAVHRTNQNSLHFDYDNDTYALFEYVDDFAGLSSHRPNNWAYLLGQALGKLHNIKPRTDFDTNYMGVDDYLEMFHDQFDMYTDQMEPKFQQMLLNSVTTLDTLEVEPYYLNHGEFTLEHILFKDDAVYKVIDWDELTLGSKLCDLGITLTEAFPQGIFNQTLYDRILSGYNSVVILTPRELGDLKSTVIWGHLKFLIWSMKKDGTGILNTNSLKALKVLLK